MQDPASLFAAIHHHEQFNSQLQLPAATTQFPEQEQLRCPRCDSSNTKFCYYNNYNLSQPRHYCKSCRRYWTKGGSLRNIPVGGGSRKTNKRTARRATASPAAARVAATPPPTGGGDGLTSLLTSSHGQFGQFLEGFGSGHLGSGSSSGGSGWSDLAINSTTSGLRFQ